jgi:hypothetical protein
MFQLSQRKQVSSLVAVTVEVGLMKLGTVYLDTFNRRHEFLEETLFTDTWMLLQVYWRPPLPLFPALNSPSRRLSISTLAIPPRTPKFTGKLAHLPLKVVAAFVYLIARAGYLFQAFEYPPLFYSRLSLFDFYLFILIRLIDFFRLIFLSIIKSFLIRN